MERANESEIKKKVFLGGTCSGWDWREELIPQLQCAYYNPIVANWCEADRVREVNERETADFVLYTITNGIKGVYSIAEVVDDSHKRPEKVLFCNLYQSQGDKESLQMSQSLKATENLLISNGIRCFNCLKAVAEYVNQKLKS